MIEIRRRPLRLQKGVERKLGAADRREVDDGRRERPGRVADVVVPVAAGAFVLAKVKAGRWGMSGLRAPAARQVP